jgi:hypothetical protein
VKRLPCYCPELAPYRGPIDAPHAFDAILFVHWMWWLQVVTPFLLWLSLALIAVQKGEPWWSAMLAAASVLALFALPLMLFVLIFWPLFLLPMAILMALAWITAKIEYHWRRSARSGST